MILLPTYNEVENIPGLVEALMALPEDIHLMIIDDNSPDGTGEVAEELKKHFPERIEVYHRVGKNGLGSAYIMGFRKALETDAAIIGQMDSDFSHSPDRVPALIEALQDDDVDIALGSRYVDGGSVDEDWPWFRKGLSAWGSFYSRTILGFPMRDATGGFRFYKRQVIEALPLERINASGYVFLVELNYLTYLMGFKTKELPIYFKDRQAGESKMNFRIQIEAAVRIWQILFSYRDMRKKKKISRK